MSTSNSSKNSQPISEEEISKRAYELWEAQGRCSNAEDDWNEAKRQLEQAQRLAGFRRIASLLNQPLIFVEKRVFEPCADWFERAAIFQIIEKLSPIIEAIGVIMIPVAIWWFTESGEELKERQQKATRGQQAVQSYLNQISNILLQGGVEKLEKNEELRNITRASTLALFENPDLQNDSEEMQSSVNDRKGQVIKYLLETKLIQSLDIKDRQKDPIISLSGANLSRANLEKANLSSANLSGANLSRAELLGAELLGAELLETDLSSANLKKANLKKANLSLANLSSANLSSANLEWADLSGANLRRTNLSSAELEWADLEWANLSSANLEWADLEWADLSGANLSSANVKGAGLSGANLSRANLSSANLSGANLSSANLSSANLWAANLSSANLRRTNLSSANLSGANLSRANLEWADLSGADLSGADLLEVKIKRAKYTDKNTKPEVCELLNLIHPCPTEFPPNFNPQAGDMTLLK